MCNQFRDFTPFATISCEDIRAARCTTIIVVEGSPHDDCAATDCHRRTELVTSSRVAWQQLGFKLPLVPRAPMIDVGGACRTTSLVVARRADYQSAPVKSYDSAKLLATGRIASREFTLGTRRECLFCTLGSVHAHHVCVRRKVEEAIVAIFICSGKGLAFVAVPVEVSVDEQHPIFETTFVRIMNAV